MDHIEMVERLREKTGLSYEEARATLERADWNLLDALITLEKEGKVHGGARYSTRDAQEPEQRAEKTGGSSFSDLLKRFWNWVCNVVSRGNRNQLCMTNKSGAQTLALPVTAFVLLLILAFWVVLPLMIIALFCGCRFSFRGPDLGKESVNRVMGKASDVADDIKTEIKNAADGEKKENTNE